MSRTSSIGSHDQQLSPDIFPLDDPFANIPAHEQQYQHFMTPDPYSFTEYPSSSDYFAQDFSFCDTQAVPQLYAEPHTHRDYSQTLPATLPAMGQSADLLKPEMFSMNDDFLNPFGISYAHLVSADMTPQHIPADFSSSRVNTTNFSFRQYPHSR